MIARIAFCLAALLSSAGCSKEALSNRPVVVITDYGTYDATVATTGDWKTAPVEISSVKNLKFKEETLRIPAKGGIYFGLHANVQNLYAYRPISVVVVLEHPPITNPIGGTKTEDMVENVQIEPGRSAKVECMWYFLDSCPQEFLPGEWTYRIDVDNRTAGAKTFEVFKP